MQRFLRIPRLSLRAIDGRPPTAVALLTESNRAEKEKNKIAKIQNRKI